MSDRTEDWIVSWEERDVAAEAAVGKVGIEAVERAVAELLPQRRVKLRSIKQGLSGAVVLLAHPTRIDLEVPLPERPGILKFGHVSQLKPEVDNYEQFVAFQLEDTASFPYLVKPKVWPAEGIAAIYYRRVGETTLGDRLAEYIETDQAPAARLILSRLFAVLAPWKDIIKRDQVRPTDPGVYGFATDPWEQFEAWCVELNEAHPGREPLTGFPSVRNLWSPDAIDIDTLTFSIGHGDLNTENVLIDSNDQVTLVDFATIGYQHYLRDLATLEAHLVLRALPNKEWDDAQADAYRQELVQFYVASALNGDPPRSASQLNIVLNHLRDYVHQKLLRQASDAPQYAVALLRHAVRIVIWDDPELDIRQRWYAAHVAMHIFNALQPRSGQVRLRHERPQQTNDRLPDSAIVRTAHRPGSLISVSTGRDRNQFIDLLRRSASIVIVGSINEYLAQDLESALQYRRAEDAGFWQSLHIVSLDEALLEDVHDDLSRVYPDPAEAFIERRKRSAAARRGLMSYLLRESVRGNWKVYTSPTMLPLFGSIFYVDDGEVAAELAFTPPGQHEQEAVHLYVRGDAARALQPVFSAVVDASQEQHEVVLVGSLEEDGFRVRGSRFRRGVLTDRGGSGDWLGAVVVVIYRRSGERRVPLLQINTPGNSTREIGKVSHVSGYLNQRDSEELAAPLRPGGLLPRAVADAAVLREFREDFGLELDTKALEFRGEVDFFYHDKENLRFWLFSAELATDAGFPPSAQMFGWSVEELLRIRLNQVLENATAYIGEGSRLTNRDRAVGLNVLIANLAAHGERDLAEDVRACMFSDEALRKRIAARQAECFVGRVFKGRRLQAEGLAGLQYRTFFSHLLPIYRDLGIVGAASELDQIGTDPGRAKGVKVLAELYGDEELMSTLPMEL